MQDPLGYFLTWNTYGTWLPGDARGWVEYRHGWQLPDPIREQEAAARMTEDACWLTTEQRAVVEAQIAETCRLRGWHLHAVNCRSNHVHVVVSAPQTAPKKVRSDLKAWATRCLKQKFDPARENWWADRGSIRFLFTEQALEKVVLYVNEAQDRKYRDEPTIRHPSANQPS
jgi:REP element-mobilizing transposase RayT